MDHYRQSDSHFNGHEEAIIFTEMIDEACTEMKGLIPQIDQVRDAIDEVDDKKRAS